MNWKLIKTAFADGAWKGWLAAVLTTTVTFGVLDTQQVTLVNNLVGAVVALGSAVMALVHTFHAATLLQQAAAATAAFPDASRP